MTSSGAGARNLTSQPAFKMFVGAGAAAAVIVPLSRWLRTQPTFAPADVGAVLVAALLMLGGAMILLPTFDPRALARALEPEAGDRATISGQELRNYRLQGLVMVLAGVLLAAPPMLAGQAGLGALAYWGLVAVFAFQTILNILVWRGADTFNRRISIEAGALSFWSLQGALFLWAAAERMGLAPAITAWGGLVIVMSVYLLAGAWAGVRRLGA